MKGKMKGKMKEKMKRDGDEKRGEKEEKEKGKMKICNFRKFMRTYCFYVRRCIKARHSSLCTDDRTVVVVSQ